MNAITDAARNGIPLNNSLMYCTTFPCHLCAKHIIAAGIRKVVYIEPYPKSYAIELYGGELIVSRTAEMESGKVRFEPFIGIAPYRYREFFERGRRKDSNGNAMKWRRGEPA
ncbi:deaminase [Bosea eneae]|uniref:Deaminase n=1 Tax=Bosea eneae TaxID=151454 RepID=A0ABW0IWH2_9HYPH